MKRTPFFILVMLGFCTACTSSQKPQSELQHRYTPVSYELYREIAHMDSVLFNAFNSRDIEKFKSLFTKDLEFYHDKDGLTGYAHTVESLQNTAAAHSDLTRELVAGSLEVYPLGDYGAVQIGKHRFCHTENGKQECGVFQFVHIWKKEEGGWKISRVVSYDHKN